MTQNEIHLALSSLKEMLDNVLIENGILGEYEIESDSEFTGPNSWELKYVNKNCKEYEIVSSLSSKMNVSCEGRPNNFQVNLMGNHYDWMVRYNAIEALAAMSEKVKDICYEDEDILIAAEDAIKALRFDLNAKVNCD